MNTSKALPLSAKTTALTVGVTLIVLTIGSYALGIDHLLGSSRTAMSVILLIAFVKVWLVAAFFMDLRRSARWLNLLVTGWIVTTCAIVVGLYVW